MFLIVKLKFHIREHVHVHLVSLSEYYDNLLTRYSPLLSLVVKL